MNKVDKAIAQLQKEWRDNCDHVERKAAKIVFFLFCVAVAIYVIIWYCPARVVITLLLLMGALAWIEEIFSKCLKIWRTG